MTANTEFLIVNGLNLLLSSASTSILTYLRRAYRLPVGQAGAHVQVQTTVEHVL